VCKSFLFSSRLALRTLIGDKFTKSERKFLPVLARTSPAQELDSRPTLAALFICNRLAIQSCDVVIFFQISIPRATFRGALPLSSAAFNPTFTNLSALFLRVLVSAGFDGIPEISPR